MFTIFSWGCLAVYLFDKMGFRCSMLGNPTTSTLSRPSARYAVGDLTYEDVHTIHQFPPIEKTSIRKILRVQTKQHVNYYHFAYFLRTVVATFLITDHGQRLAIGKEGKTPDNDVNDSPWSGPPQNYITLQSPSDRRIVPSKDPLSSCQPRSMPCPPP